jgi:hypothetical protein
MRFHRLKRREFITMVGGDRVATGGARSSRDNGTKLRYRN